jgi:hypothetical protein
MLHLDRRDDPMAPRGDFPWTVMARQGKGPQQDSNVGTTQSYGGRVLRAVWRPSEHARQADRDKAGHSSKSVLRHIDILRDLRRK